jgi:hypothetical protein
VCQLTPLFKKPSWALFCLEHCYEERKKRGGKKEEKTGREKCKRWINKEKK